MFLEEPGKIDLVYHIDEGKQWKVGRIFVHIDGDNPHTRIQTALNRLSFRPGQIVDIREIHASERRLQASSLFLANPAEGTMPKITYKIRELNENWPAPTARASAARARRQSAGGVEAAEWTPPSTVYEIRPPAGFVPDGDAIDVHLDIESGADISRRASVSPPVPPPAAQSANPYQKLVVRTQSPYQPPISQPYRPRRGNHLSRTRLSAEPGELPGGASRRSCRTSLCRECVWGERLWRPGRAGDGPRIDARWLQLPTGSAGAASPIQSARAASSVWSAATHARGAAEYDFAPPPAAAPPITPIGQPVGSAAGATAIRAPLRVPWRADESADIPIRCDRALGPDIQRSVGRHLRRCERKAQTGRLMLGVAVNSDAGLFGQILLDEQNFDWRRWPTSMEEVVSGSAWRGAGQRFRLEAMPGTQVQRYIASFQEPYLFDTPVSFGLSGSYYDRRFEDWTEQRLGGRVSFGYQWTADDLSAALAYRGENVKIYDPASDGCRRNSTTRSAPMRCTASSSRSPTTRATAPFFRLPVITPNSASNR